MMRIDEKKEKISWLKEHLRDSSASFIVGYRGLKVNELTELRVELRKSRALLQIVKNTLARRGAEQTQLQELAPLFVGPTGIVFALKEPAKLAKHLKGFMNEHPNLKIKGGVLSQTLLDIEGVLALADLPDRETLLGQLVSQLTSPLMQFVGALTSPLQNLVFAINAIIDEKKGGPSMATAPKQDIKGKKEDKKEDKKKVIIKAIEAMNILELSELVKGLEDKFGVKAAAPQVAVAVAPSAEQKVEEEKAEFDVILSEIGSKKIQVIKEVRKLTSLGLKEAKDLVEAAPKPVREGVAKEEAQKIKETLEAVGAKVELK